MDQETELHYNRYRYYDPGLGRYLRSDPIGLYGGLNLYSYVKNNPANAIDPYGLYGLDNVLTWVGGFTIDVGAVASGVAGAFVAIITYPEQTAGPEDDMIHIPPTYDYRGNIWDDLEGDVPDSATDDAIKARFERHEHCRRIYEVCYENNWSGNCSTCLSNCEVQGEWPFQMCHSCN